VNVGGTGPLAPWDDVRLRVADRKLVAASSVHGFEIWDAERSVAFGRPPNQKLAGLFATLAHKVERPPAVAISPSGNTLAFASQTPGAAVLVIGTLDGEVDEIDTPYPALNLAILDWISVGMAPNRAPFAHVRLAVERRDGGAGDAPQPRGMLQFQMLPGRVSQLSLSRDGKRFLGVLEDRIAVWYVDRPELPPDLLFVEANPVRARFAPDSIRVVSAHADGAVRIWDLSKQQQWPTTLKDAQVFARHLGECLRPPARIAVLGENSNDASNSYASCEDRQGRRGIESTRGR